MGPIVNTVGGDLGAYKDIADECSTISVRGRSPRIETPKAKRMYQVFLFALMLCLRAKGWEVTIEEPAGEGYADVRLVSKKTKSAVLIEVKSSEKAAHVEKDAKAGLQQIELSNSEGLQGVPILREYGIGCYRLKSCVEGQYLELDTQGCWKNLYITCYTETDCIGK
jgi:hypothetical protein